MYSGLLTVFLGYLLTDAAVANPTRRAPPVVTLDSATVTGTSFGRVNRYLGIPFAQPPTINRRFRRPEPLPPYTESIQAVAYGKACPQQDVQLNLPGALGLANNVVDFLVNTAWRVALEEDEDCLTVNVITPSTATPASKLPVVVWIYGGGFQFGSSNLYDGGSIVEKSMSLGEPVVYVSMNYRVSAFGFLASQEVKNQGEANFGLHDQREALRWVQKYIANFGGDPSKVTIWGESAGAVSASLQMVANDGDAEGLFHGAFMQSGSPVPVGDLTLAQPHYDQLVEDAGCAGESDTLECLRHVDFPVLKEAVNRSPSITGYNTLVLPWLPRTDGVFIKEDAQKLVQQGKIANIPYVSGGNDDEGTIFGLVLTNITTNEHVRGYIKNVWIPNITEPQLDQLMSLYPQDLTKGSPYDTSVFNALTPQFKRVSSILGDATFVAPRRWFLDHSTTSQKWVYLSKRLKATPFLGSFHASDLLNSYGSGDLATYLIHFTNRYDPNGNGVTDWPKYSTPSRQLLTFQDRILIPRVVSSDTFRQNPVDYLTTLMLDNPI